MRCRTLTLAGTVAVLASAAVSAPALAAERPAQGPAPTAHASGLLDGLLGGGSGSGSGLGGGLGGVVGGLLGDQQGPLQNLLGALQGGQTPTAGLLAPVQTLLDQLAGTAGLPAGTQDLIAQVRSLLAGSAAGDPLSGNLLLPVATLLRDIAATQGLPAELGTLLNQLADALDGDGTVGGLPVSLSLPAALVARLDDVVQQLENGGRPTGRLLAPVADLLNQVAGTEGLPPAVSQLLSQLGDILADTTGALDPLLTSQVTLALRTIAGTPGLSTSQRSTIERIATLLGSAGSSSTGGGSGAAGGKAARKATAADRAVIKRLRINKARTRISATVACPRSAPATCATLVRASFAGRKAAQGKRVRIAAGRTKVVRLSMVRAARASSVDHGGRLRVRVTTSFGSQRFAVAKGLRLKASTR